MYTLLNGNLVAVDPSGRPNRWTFRNGSLGSPPVVSGGVVYVGGSAGKVYAVLGKFRCQAVDRHREFPDR
jgi:outer membrane protein assembly factor BamB